MVNNETKLYLDLANQTKKDFLQSTGRIIILFSHFGEIGAREHLSQSYRPGEGKFKGRFGTSLN